MSKNLTQKAFVADLGVTVNTLQLWEAGKGKPAGGNIKLVEDFLRKHEEKKFRLKSQDKAVKAFLDAQLAGPSEWEAWVYRKAFEVGAAAAQSPYGMEDIQFSRWMIWEIILFFISDEPGDSQADKQVRKWVIRASENFTPEVRAVLDGVIEVVKGAASQAKNLSPSAPVALLKSIIHWYETGVPDSGGWISVSENYD